MCGLRCCMAEENRKTEKLYEKIVTLALGATFALSAFAEQDHISLLGVDYTVDTLFHAKVGPGTTQTQLRLEGPSPLNVFYLTVDRTTPNVTIRAVSGTDKVAGTSRTSVMAQTKSKDGLLYFAGTNGDFYWTGGTATNGTSKVGTPTHSFVVENEPFLTFNGGCQFIYDTNGVPHVQYINYYTGTAECGDKTTSFKGINDPASVADGLTLYTSRFWGSTNQNDRAGNCYEVTAKLVEGEQFTAGGKFKIVVTSEANTDGDTPIPADGFVLHGRGGTSQGNTGAADLSRASNRAMSSPSTMSSLTRTVSACIRAPLSRAAARMSAWVKPSPSRMPHAIRAHVWATPRIASKS